MCHANNEKWKKTMEGIELPNQENIRILGEKENYKYLGIFKVDTIKQNQTRWFWILIENRKSCRT